MKMLKKLRPLVSCNGCLDYNCGIFSQCDGHCNLLSSKKKNRDMVIKKDADFVHFVVFCLNVYLVLAGSMQEKCPISLVCCCHRHRKRSGFNLLQ